MSEQELLARAEKLVGDLAKMMNIDAHISYSIEKSDNGEAQVVKVDFEGEELGYMIGQYGRHLKAMQYIISLMLNRELADAGLETVYVNVDVGGYRKSRFDKIERLALQKAEDARILGDAIDMEPLAPAERRVVHMVLAQFEDIKTESQGEGMDRFIRIIPISDGNASEVRDEERDLAAMVESNKEIDDLLDDDLPEEVKE